MRDERTKEQEENFKALKIEDAYNPLGSEEFIDITVSLKGKYYRGLLTALPEKKENDSDMLDVTCNTPK